MCLGTIPDLATGWRAIFLLIRERFYKDLVAGKDEPLRRLFFARPVHSQFVLLAFFIEQDPEVLGFLREQLGIEGLDYVLFMMHQPPWRSKDGDSRFWYARGVVAKLLDRLYALALAPLRLEQRVPIGFRKFTRLEHLYLYLAGQSPLLELRKAYRNEQEFFKALESTYISELISEVRIRVLATSSGGSLTFRELSEGEQQLLMVIGLLRFTREDESLFLLDEPDTHLNPAWSVQYLSFLRQFGGAKENSHVVMATHDPLVIAGLTRSQVRILEREGQKVLVREPDEDPKGMGVAGLLTSDVYGLRSQLDLETLELLDEKRRLAVKESLTEEERERLDELTRQLLELDFSTSARDPLYPRFVQAMTELETREHLQTPVTTQQQAETRELALQVLRELREAAPQDPEIEGGADSEVR
jgi:ABC-type multidrug transport system ATPase subunit